MNNPRRRTLLAASLLGALLVGGAALAGPLGIFGPKGDTASQQRATVDKESAAMLAQLYASKPELRQTIQKAAGYATFSKTDVNLLLLASGNGYGVQVDGKTGKKTYMRVASLGGGVGLGVNDLRVIFIFNDAGVMKTFVDQGWQFGGNADATAKYDDVGATAGTTAKTNVDFKDGTTASGASTNAAGGDKTAGANAATSGPMQIYQFTEKGIALQATVSGTKYWKDSDLNK